MHRRKLLTLIGASLGSHLATRVGHTAPSSQPGVGHVNVVGGKLKYQSMGQGQPLVLLHKLGGRLQEWRRIAPLLAEHYRVIAFDLAGHGESHMDSEPPFIVTQEVMAAQVMGALDSLRIPPPYSFVGSSMGGCVAMVCAILWPNQVSAVASMGSALGGTQSIADLRDAAARGLARGHYDNDENPLPRDLDYARSVFGVHDTAIAREQNDSRALAGRWIGPASRGVGRFDYLGRLAEVPAPVLLAWGERGSYGGFVPPALATLPRAIEVVIPNSGAFPHEEAPEITAEIVLAFLEESLTQ